ncbi:MAG: hypothetical protein NZV14_05285 [Bryobacteraceae bacterium]|nr:hypothetical protein [Bryobacteraceae bacterium]MDW8377550.1 heavy metal-binding domain-containing protein [Bryobacterales bacterium]
MRSFLLVLLVLAQLLPGQQQPLSEEKKEDEPDFYCPMDKDIRQKNPGRCPRCGMALLVGIPEPVEFHVDLELKPRPARPGAPVEMAFRVEDPKSGQTVRQFEIVHEKLFHLFLISEDLEYFAHEHPDFDEKQGIFRFRTSLPKAGAYRVLSDFFPAGSVPQMHVRTLYVPGKAEKPKPLQPDVSPQQSVNLNVELTMEPAEPLAGFKTLMFFRLSPKHGKPFQLEPFLGAWGHMLAASQDLIDLVHTHPFLADGGPQVQFNMIFPREGIYRVWVQFQSRGEVNTVAFNIPVKALR